MGVADGEEAVRDWLDYGTVPARQVSIVWLQPAIPHGEEIVRNLRDYCEQNYNTLHRLYM